MKTLFRKSFERDIKKLKESSIRLAVLKAIEQVEAATELLTVPEVKKLSGSANAYRLRVGEYRVGLYLDGDTVEFVRLLHRREIYRFFP